MAAASITFVFTTDVHGCFFPYDFITGEKADGSLARVATAIDSIVASQGRDNVLILDNGDILQGQPTPYYYNYIDTLAPHPVPEMLDFLGYDAVTIGNHDIETGHAVYDRYVNELSIPVLGANVIDVTTEKPYFTPYTIFERGGKKIVVLGLITPAIPAWLPESLWNGLRFEDMELTAARWIPIIKQTEQPDIIIGLFHSGADSSRGTVGYAENAAVAVARNVAGFDAVFLGHDHTPLCDTVLNLDGNPVTVLNPANNAMKLAIAHYDTVNRTFQSELLDISKIKPSDEFTNKFSGVSDTISNYVERIIGKNYSTINIADALHGPSEFMTLIHNLQLRISGADISFAAPLASNGSIEAGDIRVRDMFTLYKYENMLYRIKMSGREIKGFLEESYAHWNKPTTSVYNLDSADGIIYEVDMSKPEGNRVNILSLSDGTPFLPDSFYSVAMNSYRALGGGNHMTKGAGITHEILKGRIEWATEKDLRYYLLKTIENDGEIAPSLNSNWRFVAK